MNPYSDRVQSVGFSWAGVFSGIGKIVAPILPKVAEVGIGIGGAWALDKLIDRPVTPLPGTVPGPLYPTANQANQEQQRNSTMAMVGFGVAAVGILFLLTRSRR